MHFEFAASAVASYVGGLPGVTSSYEEIVNFIAWVASGDLFHNGLSHTLAHKCKINYEFELAI